MNTNPGFQQKNDEPSLLEKLRLLQRMSYPQTLGDFLSVDAMIRDLMKERDFRIFLVLFTQPGFVVSDLNLFELITEDDHQALRMFQILINAINVSRIQFRDKPVLLNKNAFLSRSSVFQNRQNFCKLDGNFSLPAFPSGMAGTQVFAQAVEVSGSKRSDVYERLPQKLKKVKGYIPVVEWFVAKNEILLLNSYAGKIERYDDSPKILQKAILERDFKTAARYIRSYVLLPEKMRNNLRVIAKNDYGEYKQYVKRQDNNYLQCFIAGIAAPLELKREADKKS